MRNVEIVFVSHFLKDFVGFRGLSVPHPTKNDKKYRFLKALARIKVYRLSVFSRRFCDDKMVV